MAQVKPLKFDTDGVHVQVNPAADEVTFLTGQFGNVKVSANLIESTDANGDLALTPNGTGDLILDGLNWPQADGLAGQFLTTDGAGQLSWADQADDLEARRVVNEYIADEDIAARDVIYISAADNVSIASADVGTGAGARVIGLAKSAALDTEPVEVVSEGVLEGFTGLTVGARYYLDPANPGKITTTVPPDVASRNLIQIGFAKSTTALQVQIQHFGRR